MRYSSGTQKNTPQKSKIDFSNKNIKLLPYVIHHTKSSK